MTYIGEMIKKERCEQGINQNMLTKGLCSVSMLSRIETGDSFAPAELIKELLSRMGKSADKLEIIVDKSEYELEEKKRRILQLLEKKDMVQIKEEVEGFQRLVLEGDCINRRFIKEMQIAYQLLLGRRIEEMGSELRSILAETVGEVKEEDIGRRCLSIEELKLWYLIVLSEDNENNRDKSLIILNRIKRDLEECRWDEEEKVKLYPYLCYTLSEMYAKGDKWDYVLECCDEAVTFLRENKRTTCILYLMKNKLIAMKQKGKEEIEEYKIYQKYMDAYERVELEAGTHIEQVLLSIFQQTGGAGYFLLGEVIRGRRKQFKLTQEKFSEKVDCSREYISRLESGKKSISKRNYERLADSLQMYRERTQATILTSEYEILEKRREVGVLIQNRQYEKARSILKELEKQIDMSIPENGQSIMCLETIILKGQRKLSSEESLKKYMKALQLTIPQYPDIILGECRLRREEVTLLNNIALYYGDCGKIKEAAEILKNILLTYENSKVDISCHCKQVVLILFNYARYLGLLGEHEIAIKYCKEAIQLNIKYGRGNEVSALFYSIGWNLKEMKQDISIYKKYCLLAYYISELMKEDERKNEILELYKKNCGEKLI